jgi:predicted RecB family nuclease
MPVPHNRHGDMSALPEMGYPEDVMTITASMLYSYTTCPHRVMLDLFGDPAERDKVSPFVEMLWERGHLFEQETIASLGVPFLNLRAEPRIYREQLTQRAMQRGERLIYGGRISHGELLGEPDLLRHTETGYEPGDIKSGAGVEGASEDTDGKLKPHYAVQLALYADILLRKGLSGCKHAFVWDVRGDEVGYDLDQPRGPRIGASMWDEYTMILADVDEIVARRAATRPALISACSLCHWRTHCRHQMVEADDLTLIPELGRSTRDKFPPGLSTVAALAGTPLEDLIVHGKSQIAGIGARTLQKYHARAVLQKERSPVPYFLEPVRLPKRPVELFFDVETDPFRGLCYLHGFVERSAHRLKDERYVAFLAEEPTQEAERVAFARAWAYVKTRSDAVVYYYSKYERTTWAQLAARYPDVAAKEDVLALFEDERFIDLYNDIVRSRMIWPTVSLSIKALARHLGFRWRDTDPSGAASIHWFHRWVETGDPQIRQRILDYNEDDCRATRVLVDTLNALPDPPIPHRDV